MNETLVQAAPGETVETVLREELVQGDALIGTIGPILRHLLASDEHSVFGDEIIARVRGMISDIASQLLDAVAQANGDDTACGHDQAAIDALTRDLVGDPAFLAHVHALAMEWQLTVRLHTRLALDPVLSPLLQALIASPDAPVAANAMALLASQARFAQTQRRMQLPISELPGDLLHAALLRLRAHAGDDEQAQVRVAEAERAIRGRYDESRSRLGLIARVLAAMGGAIGPALAVIHAGVAIFASALALASRQDRDISVLATNEGQMARLALALRASGLKPETVEEQFVSLHPDIVLPEGFDQVGPDRAAALLAHSTAFPGV